MEKINNKNGIEMFWALSDIEKVDILDSNGNYFNDLYYVIDEENEDLNSILKMLEETTLENMCNFFGARKYKSLEEMAKMEDLELDGLESNEYTNIFNVNGTTFYTWSW